MNDSRQTSQNSYIISPQFLPFTFSLFFFIFDRKIPSISHCRFSPFKFLSTAVRMSSIHQQTTSEVYKWQDWPVVCKSRNFSLLMLSDLSSSLSLSLISLFGLPLCSLLYMPRREEEERRRKSTSRSFSHFRLRGTNCANTKLKYPAR